MKISGSLPYFAGLDFSVAIAGWRRFNSVVVIAAITFIGYSIGAELASVLRIPATRSSIFWIPNAVLLTVLLATAPRRWCIWLLAALPAHILAQSRSDGAAIVVLAPFAANVAQVTLAAFALRFFGVTLPRFDVLRETILFVCIAVLLAPATASLAAGWLFVNVGWEKDVWLVSSGRFLNNVTTGLTVAPLLLLGASAALGKAGQSNSRRIIEYVILVSILVGVLCLAREWRSAEIHKIPVQLYLPLPFLIWAAVRFGVGGLSVCLLAVAVCSIADALEGRGPYTFEAPADNLLALQVSLTVLSVPLIFLASAMAERRKNDAALQSSEERYRNVVEDQTELVCRYLPDATLTFVNGAYARYFGRSADQLISSSFLDLIPEAQREAAGAYLRGLVEISAVGSHEHEVLTPRGEQRWQHWVDRPILDSSGRVIEFQGVGRDITDRKRAETRLEVQYAVTRVLAEADSLADASSRTLQAVCEALDSDLGEIWREDGDYRRLILDQTWHRPQASLAAFAEASRYFSFSHGEGLPGWAWQNGKPVWISQVGNSQYFQRKTLAAAAGLQSAFAVRVGGADETTFVLVFFSRRVRHHDKDLLDTLANIGEQIGQFVGRRRAEALVRDNEKLLRQKDEQLARTQRFSSVMVTHTSLEGRWLKVPPTFCDLLGYAEDELLGRRFHEFTHPDDIEKDWEQCQRLNREEIKSFELEKRYIRKDATIVWVSLTVSMVTDLDGRPLHFLSYIRDVSDRKRIEDDLRRSEMTFSGIVAIAAEAIISVDEEHKITLFNEGAEHIFGYSKYEVMGRSLDMLLPQRFRHGHNGHLREFSAGKVVARRMGERQEIFGLRKNGDEFPAEASISQLDIEGQRLFNVVLRDITERNRAEILRTGQAHILEMIAVAAPLDKTLGGITRLVESLSGDGALCSVVLLDEDGVHVRHGAAPNLPGDYTRQIDGLVVGPKAGSCGTAIYRHKPVIVTDILEDALWDDYRELAVRFGLRACWSTPFFSSAGKVLGSFAVYHSVPCSPSAADEELNNVAAHLASICIERKCAEETLKSAFGEVERLKERLEDENVVLRAEVSGAHREDQIIGRSLAIRKIVRQIRQVARTDTSVLILGETGTGKELVARAVHRQSSRNGHPMVGINCAALPETLMESELFGHERGAFTGAGARMIGRFEIADGGSIFLDEIGDLPLNLQAKLLRVLQEGEFERLGSGKTLKTSVRVIAATNRNLSEAMRKGTFRTDLYYRLAVYPINVPPLRERKDDIALMAERFLREAGRRLGRNFDRVPAKVLESLVCYDWPGNVRELQNVVERAAVISVGEELRLPDEWMQVVDAVKPLQSTGDGAALPGSTKAAKGSTLDDLERTHILCILRETRWRIEGPKGAASILGIRPSTLRSRMSKLGIQRYSEA